MNVYEENTVTMTLGEFVRMRDDIVKLESIKEYAWNNRCGWDESKRYDSSIGEYVRDMFGIPEKVEEEA